MSSPSPLQTRRGSAPARCSTVEALMREARPQSQRRRLRRKVFLTALLGLAAVGVACWQVSVSIGSLHLVWCIPVGIVLVVGLMAAAAYTDTLGWRALVVLSRAALAYRDYSKVDAIERQRKKPYEIPNTDPQPSGGAGVKPGRPPEPQYEGVPQELEDELQQLWDAAHAQNAGRLLTTATRCRGMWIKFCQMLSSRADAMPPVYLQTLSGCQDSLPPPPLKVTLRTLRQSFSAYPPNKDGLPSCFASLAPSPLAVASIGAVYRGRLAAEGTDVVVKVLHDGIAEKIGIDLDIIRFLMEKVAERKPQWDFRWAIDEWITEVWQEVDLRVEAANLRDVSAGVLHIPELGPPFTPPCRVELPSTIEPYVTRQALVMEYIEGKTLGSVIRGEVPGLDSQLLARSVAHVQAYQMYVMGAFNGDPHPGNFFVRVDPELPGGGALVPLDFGLVKRPPRSFRIAACDTVLATIEDDRDRLLAAFEQIGFRLKHGVSDLLPLFVRLKFDPRHRREKEQEAQGQLTQEQKDRRAAMRRDGDSPVDQWPETFVFYDRSLSLMRNLCGSLGWQASLLPVVEPFARLGVMGSPKAAARATQQWAERSKAAAADGEPKPTEFEAMLKTFKPGLLTIFSDKVKELTPPQMQSFSQRILGSEEVPQQVKATDLTPDQCNFAFTLADGEERTAVFRFPHTMETMQDLKEFGAELRRVAEDQGLAPAPAAAAPAEDPAGEAVLPGAAPAVEDADGSP